MGKELDALLMKPHDRMSAEDWGYWVAVATQFLERYNIELGINNAYGGHLALLLFESYKAGVVESRNPTPTKVKPGE